MSATDSSDGPQYDARQLFARGLATIFLAENYAAPYLARRCRTTPERIHEWRNGDRLPNSVEWDFLCRVSREFIPMIPYWERAQREAQEAGGSARPIVEPPTPPVADHAREVAEDLGTAPDRERGDDADRGVREGLEQSTQATTRAIAEGDPTGEAPRDAGAPTDARRVIFLCKISRGRFVQLPMPLDLTRADVWRIHAFLMTQVSELDDEQGSR